MLTGELSNFFGQQSAEYTLVFIGGHITVSATADYDSIPFRFQHQ